MNSLIPTIDPKKETEKIGEFLESTLKKTGYKKIVIGLSGGIDSTTSLYLVRRVLPPENIFIAHLYYFKPHISLISPICHILQIPRQNQYILSIKKQVNAMANMLKINNLYDHGRDRIGNIMARMRMIILFDLAKKHKALVCGTENKSERLLGYFTRFGDAASDIEPITHLYKTQVYQLAKSLKFPPIPKEVLTAAPSAGLWSDQTDESEFGFSYQEADQVLYLYHDRGQDIKKIEKLGYKNIKKIIDFALKNFFKHRVPYFL